MHNFTSNDGLLEQRIETHYQTLLQRVASRLSPSGTLDWMLHPPHAVLFRPDYLPLSGWGRNRIERALNRSARDYALFLWYRIFWPKIHRGLVAYTATRYLPGFFQHQADHDERKIGEVSRYITGRIDSFLARPWNAVHECAGYEMSNFIAAVTHDTLRAYVFPNDLFAVEKQQQNARCLALVRDIREALRQHPRCVEIMVYSCCRANRIDSVHNDCSSFFDDFKTELAAIFEHGRALNDNRDRNAYYHIRRFEALVHDAPKRILYECDNCGEIVFDLLLIEYVLNKGHRVDLCAKACPAVNDATLEDVKALLAEDMFAQLQHAMAVGQFTLLSSGVFQGGGKLAYDVSEEYKRTYQQADLLILKGQGNFQTMPMGRRYRRKCIPYRYKKPILFMMEIKDDMVLAALECIFPARNCPEKHSLFVYYYDPLNPDFS